LLAALAFVLAFVIALALGTFTRRAAVTSLLGMGLFVGLLGAAAGTGAALLVWGPALGLVVGLVVESIRDTAQGLRPLDTPARTRTSTRKAATRRAA
jgi:hypothetical protein